MPSRRLCFLAGRERRGDKQRSNLGRRGPLSSAGLSAGLSFEGQSRGTLPRYAAADRSSGVQLVPRSTYSMVKPCVRPSAHRRAWRTVESQTSRRERGTRPCRHSSLVICARARTSEAALDAVNPVGPRLNMSLSVTSRGAALRRTSVTGAARASGRRGGRVQAGEAPERRRVDITSVAESARQNHHVDCVERE